MSVCGSSLWLIRIGKMKLSNRELDNSRCNTQRKLYSARYVQKMEKYIKSLPYGDRI